MSLLLLDNFTHKKRQRSNNNMFQLPAHLCPVITDYSKLDHSLPYVNKVKSNKL